MTTVTHLRKKKSSQQEVIAALETAADRSNAFDVSPFVQVYDTIDWNDCPPDDLVYAVRLALDAGAHIIAQELALRGARYYPDHAELQNMAHILGPPIVKVSKASPRPGIKANRDWLKANWGKYRGRWVALRDGQLLAVAESLDGLVEQVGEVKNTDILVTPIW